MIDVTVIMEMKEQARLHREARAASEAGEVARIYEAYQEHGGVKGAAALGIPLSRMYRVMREAHPEALTKYNRRGKKTGYDPKRVVQLCRSGLALREVAEMLDVDLSTLNRIIRKGGYVPAKRRGRAIAAPICDLPPAAANDGQQSHA